MLGIFHELVQNTRAQQNGRRTKVRFKLVTAMRKSTRLINTLFSFAMAWTPQAEVTEPSSEFNDGD